MENYSDSDIALRPLQISDGAAAVKWYMDKKVRLASNAAFVEWGHLEWLEALVDVENAGSQQVMEKDRFVRVLETSDPPGSYCSIQ